MAIFTGTNGSDSLDGGGSNDSIYGLNGNDTLNGLGADDIIDGGTGNDTLDGGTGNDNLLGNSGNDILVGGIGDDRLDGGAGTDTLTGGTGDDIYVVDNAHDVVAELAGEGNDTVEALATYILPAEIENLTITAKGGANGTGNSLDNILTGNSAANALYGMDGNDTVNGGSGADKLFGGMGDDFYVVDNAGDRVTENAAEGIDSVISSVTYKSTANIENIALIGPSVIDATGNDLDNLIIGSDQRNTLDGSLGADTLLGGLGDDTYIVDNAGDAITENAGEGNDTVKASVTYTLAAPEVENLTLTGAAAIDGTGNAAANILIGNTASNSLDGGSGDDTLDGGKGADVLIGSTGNDVFLVDSLGDVVVENSGEGNDTVKASINYTLAPGSEIESLILAGTAKTGAGNEFDNTIIGNAGVNVLDGGLGNDTLDGAGGNDTMRGGLGDDTFVVGSTGDIVTENASEGTDTVMSAVTYTLGNNLENLTLTGSTNLNATGNALDNILTGNGGNNTLDGLGGADTMQGGLGDDTYIIDNPGETVTENASEGNDTVRASISDTLSAGVENLLLTGAADTDGTGNSGDNTLTGNTGANILSGGLGNDTYVIDALDTIIDAGGNDTVRVGFSYATGGGIENITLTGTGAFNATGDAGDNTLTGNTGVNTLDGGLGNDTYVIGANDVIVDAGGADSVMAGFNYTLVAGMESLTLTGTGAFHATGNASDNILIGNSGNNIIDGHAGADVMLGGFGNDTYYIDDTGDSVTEDAGAGIDIIYSSVSHTLEDHVENLTLTGNAVIDGTGNMDNNVLTGNSAANTLDGGLGADTMTGGAGNDIYIVDNASDVIKESAGTDSVISSVSYTLDKNIENLTLAGGADLNATGNLVHNVLTGNTGNNTLDGMGGGDILIGGMGDDTYIVHKSTDVLQESTGEGNDSVISSVTYTLAHDVEQLTLTGTATLHGTGNSIDNVINGNGGNNVLDGAEGNDTLFGFAGNDQLIGGLGDDILSGDLGLDVLQGGAGADSFVFKNDSAFLNVDIIRDYSQADGDIIDVKDIIDTTTFDSTSTNPMLNDIHNYLNIAANGSIQVDISGSGHHFVNIGVLQGMHGIVDETAVYVRYE